MKRSRAGRIAPGVALLGLVLATGAGCVYYNGLYNARQAFEAGERARLEGRTDSARVDFDRAAAGAQRAWIAEPEGGWADDALLLTARSALRLGDRGRAIEALELLESGAPDTATARRARLLRGAVDVLEGRPTDAIGRLEATLDGEASDSWRGEAHLWLARARFGSGEAESGFAELDRAVAADGRLERAVALERLDEAIRRGDRRRAGDAAAGLFRTPAGAAWADSILSLTEVARRDWGPGDAAELIAPLRDGRWAPEARDELLLRRADFLLAAGDTAEAATALEWMAEGSGQGAVEARLHLTDVRLARASTFAELVAVRRVLLPVAEMPGGHRRLLDIGQVEVLAGWGARGNPVAYFAAAEIARDDLDASRLARALFLTAAEAESEGPWAGKSLLAALALADSPELQARIRQRLLRRTRDPYSERIRPGYLSSELHDLWETELTHRVRELRQLSLAEARRFVPGMGETAEALGSGTTATAAQPMGGGER